MCIQGRIIPGGLDLRCLHCPACLTPQGGSVIPPGMADEKSGPALHSGLEMGFSLSISPAENLENEAFCGLKDWLFPQAVTDRF